MYISKYDIDGELGSVECSYMYTGIGVFVSEHNDDVLKTTADITDTEDSVILALAAKSDVIMINGRMFNTVGV